MCCARRGCPGLPPCQAGTGAAESPGQRRRAGWQSGHRAPGAAGLFQQARDPALPVLRLLLPSWPAGMPPDGRSRRRRKARHPCRETQRPGCPRSLLPGFRARALRALCRRARGASPAARYFQSRTRRKVPYQDKSPRRRHPPAPASPTPGAVGGAGSADGCIYRAGGLSKRFNPLPRLCRRRQRVRCPAPQAARWAPALLTLRVGRGRSSLAAPAPINLSLFSVCCLAGPALDGSSAPRSGTAKQGPTQSSPNTSRAGSKGHLRLGSCGRSEAHTPCQDSSTIRTMWT